MLKVVKMVNKEVVSTVKFNERTDDDAMKKALVECDRAIWDRDDNELKGFMVALMQGDRVLRYATDGDWMVPKTSIYG